MLYVASERQELFCANKTSRLTSNRISKQLHTQTIFRCIAALGCQIGKTQTLATIKSCLVRLVHFNKYFFVAVDETLK